MVVLHDLRVPGGRANIDHIVVTPTHVFVIDAKRYTGEVCERDHGDLVRADIRLSVGGRDRSNLIRASLDQAATVSSALAGIAPGHQVRPVLCIVRAEWPLLGRPLEIDGVLVTWPRALASTVASHADGPAVQTLGAARATGQIFQPAA